MILFAMACGVTMIMFLQGEKIPKDYVILIGLFSLALSIALLIGTLNGGERRFWWEDLKPLSYFYILPFFYFASANEKSLSDTAVLVKISSLIQAVAFFVLLILIHSEVIPFLKFYYFIIDAGELFFRGETTFFYKGFLYMCIGFIFFCFNKTKGKTTALVFLGLAIVLSFTRGFIFALLLTGFTYSVVKMRWMNSIVYITVALMLVLFSNVAIEKLSALLDQSRQPAPQANSPKTNHAPPPNTKLLGDRNFSDAGRAQQAKEVLSQITPVSLFVGHGFGIGIPSRPVHMEISYLEIFHKQGLIGLCLWGYIFFLLLKRYLSATPSTSADAFFCAGVFVYCQSLTNQFVNNPIGMSMVLLAIVILDRMRLPGSSLPK